MVLAIQRENSDFVVAFTYTMSLDNSLPHLMISANPRIEIAE